VVRINFGVRVLSSGHIGFRDRCLVKSRRVQPTAAISSKNRKGVVPCQLTISAFERTSKRRKGYPSEAQVKKGARVVHGNKELFRETGTQRSMPLRLCEVVSRTVACAAVGSMAQGGIIT
jgi:hypothetical protein